jgi:hypothetical protein
MSKKEDLNNLRIIPEMLYRDLNNIYNLVREFLKLLNYAEDFKLKKKKFYHSIKILLDNKKFHKK